MSVSTGEQPTVNLRDYGDAFFSDPYAVFADLRAHGPVHHVRLPNGTPTWLIVDHAEVRRALGDPTLSKNWYKATGQLGPNVMGTNMLTCDPPDHTRLRRLLSKEFTARRVEALRPQVQASANRLLDEVAHTGRMDLIESYSMPLSIGTVTDLLGVPFLDKETFREWTRDIFVPTGDVERERQVYDEITAYIDELVEAKRRDPGPDLLSALVRTVDSDDDRLKPDELRATAFLLLLAGHQTTLNLVTNGAYALLTHPDQLAALRSDWSVLDRAVDEVLRWEGSLTFATHRFTTEPYPVGGTVIPGAGQRVLVAVGAANRDPAQHPDPDRFDIHRPAQPHMAFGHGIHHCLGSSLARLEGAVALRSLFGRLDDLALDTDRIEWQHTLTARGITRLPVRWPV
ncbi:hypothetical protein ALI144C_17005 [Actinosynnema sp. ALI-1.44]|uniref:cytochrome P450 family protein n=1 Tax=Actinosynnema sp. ALI-1.44 TaxID=1933779 RepID=UPI00097C5142|nr:cytochrome P450 [Actinosynnema sp. ALI-1.44]ONI83195.1 hypothetical protein ALI144C_17005 [Actinosynnema sp. ALI-1.44]